jgi:WD40 repeat protein
VIGSGTDNQIRLWDIRSGKILQTIKGHQGKITSLLFSPNNKFFISSSTDHTARMWQAPSGKLVRVFR